MWTLLGPVESVLIREVLVDIVRVIHYGHCWDVERVFPDFSLIEGCAGSGALNVVTAGIVGSALIRKSVPTSLWGNRAAESLPDHTPLATPLLDAQKVVRLLALAGTVNSL